MYGCWGHENETTNEVAPNGSFERGAVAALHDLDVIIAIKIITICKHRYIYINICKQ